MIDIEKIPCSSSNVDGYGFDEENLTLRVWYSNGSIYDYSNVPRIEFESLHCSPSIGSYLARSIKGVYFYNKVG
jgi:hypothetical protein